MLQAIIGLAQHPHAQLQMIQNYQDVFLSWTDKILKPISNVKPRLPCPGQASKEEENEATETETSWAWALTTQHMT